MPSIFSRSRLNSTPSKKSNQPSLLSPNSTLDEFGRIHSNASASTSKKSSKKYAKEQEKARIRTLSTLTTPESDPQIPDGTFLPINLDPPPPPQRISLTLPPKPTVEAPADYGYLSYSRHIVLGLPQLSRLVSVVCDELSTRGGLTTPFIFSSLALDISASAIKRLISTFLDTCRGGGDAAERKWRDEAKFAGMHELGMFLRWALARVVRYSNGVEVRGLVPLERYFEFRDSEAGKHQHRLPLYYQKTTS